MARPIHLGAHARDELARRALPRLWVERVARGPLWVEPDPEVVRCFGVVPEAGDRVLRVAVVERAGVIFVVTAHFDRSAGRQLRRGERP